MCYFQPWEIDDCGQNPVQAVVTGPIASSDTGASPTTFQCYELLLAEWPAMKLWFKRLFPEFTGPIHASKSEKAAIKYTIYLWILHFGPNEVGSPDWDELRTALNDPASDWTKFLGWAGTSTPQYLTNGTRISMKKYPGTLKDWLKSESGCKGVTAGCADLQVFNSVSKVCEVGAGCTVEDLCREVNSTSNCAIYARNS